MKLRFLHPEYLILLAVLLPFVLYMGRRATMLGKRRRALALALRCLIFTLLVCTLAEAYYSLRTDHLTVIYVLDQSSSVPPDDRTAAEGYIKKSLDNMGDKDRAGILIFGGDVSMEYAPRPRLSGKTVEFRSVVDRNQTNIATALRLALAAFGDETQKRIVLISDGNETQGYANEIARQAKSHNAVIDILPIIYENRNDLVVDKLVMPGRVKFDEPFNLRVFVRANIDTKAKMTVYRDGDVILNDQEITLIGGRKNPFTMTTQIPETNDSRSFHSYEVRVSPLADGEADANKENNRANAFTWTTGKPRVLLIEGQAMGKNDLAATLLADDIRVDLRSAAEIPYTYEDLLSYDSIIFSNVAAFELTRTQMKWIENAVRELGIGFVMIGGDKSFGAGGYQDTPIEKCLPVSMDIKHKKVILQGALALILHTCEFANGNKWARDIARAALDVLSSRDLMGVLYYSHQNGDSWLYKLQEAGDKVFMLKKISTCQPGDMPAFDPTMQMAYKALSASGAGIKHIVIISDGDAAPPSKKLINSLRAAKITVTTICINPHSGRDSSGMQNLAKQTGGRYYFPKSPTKLPQIFIKEATMVRQSLIVNQEFTPAYQPGGEMLAGFGEQGWPKLQGYVATSEKPLADISLLSHEEHPILASWRYGVGKTVAFTSDARADGWARDWLGWNQFSKFWTQTIRWSMRGVETGDYQLTTTIENGVGRVVIDSTQEDEGADFDAVVISPDLKTEPLRVRQVAAGRYEGTFDATGVGTYFVRAQPRG
ncbi:glutamine amidotransferase, partial [Candidatus Sumerlaeota bacterium]